MMLCSVKVAIVFLLFIVSPVLGSDCVNTTTTCTTTTVCTTTPACLIDGNNNGTDTDNKTIKFLTSNNDCDNSPDGTLFLDNRHCRRYYMCVKNRVVRQRCDLGKWYDRVLQTCRLRALVTNCAVNRIKK